jgi:hypothetical protein
MNAENNSRLIQLKRKYNIPATQVNTEMISRSHRIKTLVDSARDQPSKFSYHRDFQVSGPIPEGFKVSKLLEY